MSLTKAAKNSAARKTAEADKARRKAARTAKAANVQQQRKPGQKGKSLVPQSKNKKK